MNRFSLVTCCRFLPLFCIISVMGGLASCKRLTERMEITETREISKYEPKAHANVPSSTRFYDEKAASSENPGGEQAKIPLAWDTPAGWKEAPSDGASGMAGMRLINLAFGPNGEGECYLSAMPGAAGGLAANVNRWRAQMSLPPMTEEELGKLPKKTFLGHEATYVSFDGDFKGMGAAEAKTGYRLVGLVQPAPEFTLFVKMTGPKDLVTANEAAFEKFCQSISVSHPAN
jgi:hypothetical protein